MTWDWSHPSLEPRQDYSVARGRIVMGRAVIAYMRRGKVVTPAGEEIGDYDSPAHAMMIAIRHHEAAS